MYLLNLLGARINLALIYRQREREVGGGGGGVEEREREGEGGILTLEI